MTQVKVKWDSNYFDGFSKLLPDVETLYTQIYLQNSSWSIKFKFDPTPRVQGYKSIGSAEPLVKGDAPEDLLYPGKEFPFLDGSKEIGSCKVLSDQTSKIANLLRDLDTAHKFDLQIIKAISTINLNNQKVDNSSLKKLLRYADRYPSIFSLVSGLNIELAIRYLKNHYLNEDFKESLILNSNLPILLQNIKSNLGSQEFKLFIEQLPDSVTKSDLFSDIKYF